MSKSKKRRYLYALAAGVVVALVCGIAYLAQNRMTPGTDTTPQKITEKKQADTSKPTEKPESYKGKTVLVADTFTIKVPNGWSGSISKSPHFLAIMFARPNQLASLTYNAATPPAIDELGIPSWNGLTEHFFIIMPTAANTFDPKAHLEVSSKPFVFDDGVKGKKYYVVKHAAEAQKWGGLQKDTEWQGRTYIYEKAGKRVEAHLALYPSTKIDITFYEEVVRSVRVR